ncbi:MAG: hypothetical protein J6T01_04020, partial [Kiritimatiellae bacterium]|nr:hypothetical protein [Kiritimatiellia bacterium]
FDDPSGAIRATPVGYTLETLDRSTGEWSDPVAYAGTSYTHGQTGAAATRLTWRWSTGRAPAVLAPIENGLQYRLDASDISSLTTNEDGQVTEWRANAGALAIAFTNATKYCPYYNANAFGDGLPGVVFGLCKDGKTKQYASYQYTSDLISNLATTNQTVMMVLKMSVQGSSMSYYWGPDRGSALIGATGSKYGVYCTDFVTDSIYFNGVFQWKMPDPYTTITYKNYTFNAPTWLCAVSASARGFALTGLGNSKRNFANSSEGPRSMYGPISEVLVWDRKLTDAERQYMDEYIRRKWILRGKNTVWTGSGLSTDWHDTANWSPSAVPVDGQTAVLSNATVSISGEWSAPNLLMLGGNQVQFTGDCGVAVAEGKKLTLPECTVFNEGTTLTKYGLGTLAAGCDSTVDGVSLNFVNGVFDLNGTTQRFASVTGIHGTVTNSAETAGTLIVDTGAADGEAKLTARVAGNAAVVRTGAGALAVGGMLDNTQGVALSGGATTATAAELPAIAGCVLHLDAKRFDSFDTNENGCVTCWRSLTNPDYRFDAPSTYEPRLPRYDPTAFDGLGGVSFGKDPVGGTNAMSYLAFNHTSESLSIRTHFFVFRQRKNVLLGAVFGAVWGDSFIFRNIHGNSDSTSSWGTLNCDGGDAWVNGECIYDAFGAPSVIYTNELLIANSTNKTYGASRTGCLGLMHYYDDPKIGATELTAVRRKNSSYDWKLNYAPAIGATVQYTRYLDGWVGEIIFYDRILTDAEFRRVQKYLIDKWHVTPRSTVPNGGALHSGAELTLAAGAALDLGLGAFTQTVAKVTALGDAAVTNGALAISEALETRAGQGGEIPLLRLEGGIDLTGVDFTLSGATAESMGAVLQTDGAVTGPFRSVEARDPAAVRYRRHSVSYGVPGLLLFLR